MLSRLAIRNYALIESVELEFGPGLTVITGETGSGKSIMLGALSLLLGTRADSRVAGTGKSRVEATFEDVDPAMRQILEDKGIDWIESEDAEGRTHNEVTIRREIAAEGRSRAFVNDIPVTLSTLQAIGPKLVYIHSQHANAGLNDPAEQLHVIDVFSHNSAELEKYRVCFRRFVELKRRIAGIRERVAKSRENEEFLRFQFAQLDKLKPKRDELPAIERRYEVLSDADEIKEHLSALSALLGQGDSGLLSGISEARGMVDRLDFGMFGNNAVDAQIPERIEVLETELRDIADTIEDINASVDTDPATLGKLSERMKAYYDAVKYFKVRDANELVDLYDKIRSELGEIGGDGGELPELEREARGVAGELRKLAGELTETRRKGAAAFGGKLISAARTLGLPNLRFEVVVEPGKMSSTGQDHVVFMCSFNRNSEMRPVGETASGGEMSRLMLSLKAVEADKVNMPTIVFDEVDTGVSGEIAERMGGMMRNMGGHMQVMAITHLPQVAAQGANHFKVYKRDENNRTVTHVERLTGEQRVREIASMISGSTVTEAAMANARALLANDGVEP